MKKVALALATLATIAVAAPTLASAEDFGVGIRVGSDGYRDRGDYYRESREFRGARAEYRGDRGWHRGWDRGWDRDHGERTIIIKRRHHHHDWD